MQPPLARRSRARWTRALRAAAASLVAGAAAPAAGQTLTYQAPASTTSHSVTNGPYTASAYDYTVPSGSASWSPESTITWRTINEGVTATVTPGTFFGRIAYRFFLQDGTSNSCPWWGCFNGPRVEWDSATPEVQNTATPPAGGWSAGVIVPGMTQVIAWSMYLDPAFPLDQQWATLFQFHPGNVNYVSGGWPGVMVNKNVIAFGFGPDTSYPGQLWYGTVSALRGRWVDFALRVRWSTGSDGFMTFYVDGIEQGTKLGDNFHATNNGQPFYYVKQGYYRAQSVTASGTVYETPALVSTPGSCAPDFAVSASPSSVFTPAGGTGTSTVTVTPTCGFTGTVSLSASGAPAGASASLSPTAVTITGSTAAQATLAVSAGTAAPGSATLTVTGTASTLSRSAAVAWTIGSGGGSVADALFVRQYGTPADEYGYGVALNRAGDLYFSGYTMGDLFAGNNGIRDAILGKYSPDGLTRRWGAQLGAGAASALSLAIDPTDNVYIAGWTTTSMWDVYQGGASDAFVALYPPSSTGLEEWSLNFGTSAADGAQAVTTDAAGNIYVAGYTDGVMEPGGASAGGRDAFVTKIEPVFGTHVWTKQLGSAGTDVAYGVAVASDGSVYVTGSTSGALPGKTSAGGLDMFLAKYDAAGNLVWLAQRGTPLDDEGLAVAADASGNAYVAGSSAGSFGFTNQGGVDAFLAQYLPGGQFGWTRQLGSSGDEWAYGVAFDGSGALYITGSTTGALHGASSGGHDVYAAKYLLDGSRPWVKQVGTAGDEVGRTVHANSTGAWVVGGTFGSFPGYTNAGGKDVILAKFAP